MRRSVVSITYPVWADLVPAVARTAALFGNLAQSSVQGDGAQSCFTLTLIDRPLSYDPVSYDQGGPKDLNLLERLLTHLAIPMDVVHSDLDRPWRDTLTNTFLRRDENFELHADDPIYGRLPLWYMDNPLSNLTQVLAACLLNPDPDAARHDLSIWHDMVSQVPRGEVSVILIAASKLERLQSHFLPLVSRGLLLEGRTYAEALDRLHGCTHTHDAHCAKLAQAHSEIVSQALLARLGCTVKPDPAERQKGAAFALPNRPLPPDTHIEPPL